MSTKKKDEPRDWEVEQWARTVIEAAEILADPAKMKHVKGHIDKKKKAFKSLDELKDRIAKGE